MNRPRPGSTAGISLRGVPLARSTSARLRLATGGGPAQARRVRGERLCGSAVHGWQP